jgi:membrane associated rhomboid family serine protease
MRSFYLTHIRGQRVNQFIAINALVFLVINAFQWGFKLDAVYWLSAPASPSELLLKPWTLLTHMFTHQNFGHLFFNMLVLYFMGQFFLQLQNAQRFTALYLGAGLSGYAMFVIAFGFGGRANFHHEVIGASAAAMGLVIATAVLRPLQPIHLFGVFRMELRWLAGLMVLMDLFSIKEGVNSGGHIGHLVGAIFGLVYGFQLTRGSSFLKSSWFQTWNSKRKLKVTHRQGRPKSDEQFNAERAARNKRTDAILDKISRNGYEALTKEEKDFLFHHSDK